MIINEKLRDSLIDFVNKCEMLESEKGILVIDIYLRLHNHYKRGQKNIKVHINKDLRTGELVVDMSGEDIIITYDLNFMKFLLKGNVRASELKVLTTRMVIYK